MTLQNLLRSGAAALAIALAPLAAQAEDNPVVATVNGEDIHRSAVTQAYENLPAQYQQVPLEQIFPALLNSVIDTKLAAAEARSRGLDKTDDFRREMDAFADRLLGSTVLQEIVDKEVTDAAVKARYEKMAKQMAGGSEVHARHILLKSEDEAKAVIKELAGGADFASVAKKKSTGPSGAKGGDLGYFGKGQMVPAFEKVAFSMDEGAISKRPVKTQFGWHVIKIEDKRTKEAPTLEEMEQKIRQTLVQEAGEAYTLGLRENADIKRFNLDGTPAK